MSISPLEVRANSEQCQEATIVYPAQDQTLRDSRPGIRWQPIADVSEYRVRIRSRVPEGEVMINVDTIVRGEHFVPPRALTDFRAIVRLSVTTGCASSVPQIESGVRFFVDTAPLCVLGDIKEDASDPTRISWESVANALEYEAWFYQMPESILAAKTTTRDRYLQVPVALMRPAIVAIRPRCPGGYGEPVDFELEDKAINE